MLIELYHPTDPRWLLVEEPPARITPDELFGGECGKPLIFAPATPTLVYEQPNGPGTDWIRPAAYTDTETTKKYYGRLTVDDVLPKIAAVEW